MFNFITKHFNELTTQELYAILKLRSEVFVVEQDCVYLDTDGKDIKCHHIMVYNDDTLVAYARLVPAGISYNEISIGRVVSAAGARKTGAGKALMDAAIEACYNIYGRQPIKIGAQLYLKKFYEGFGFIQTSDVYDEDGIDHIEMVKD